MPIALFLLVSASWSWASLVLASWKLGGCSLVQPRVVPELGLTVNWPSALLGTLKLPELPSMRFKVSSRGRPWLPLPGASDFFPHPTEQPWAQFVSTGPGTNCSWLETRAAHGQCWQYCLRKGWRPGLILTMSWFYVSTLESSGVWICHTFNLRCYSNKLQKYPTSWVTFLWTVCHFVVP